MRFYRYSRRKALAAATVLAMLATVTAPAFAAGDLAGAEGENDVPAILPAEVPSTSGEGAAGVGKVRADQGSAAGSNMTGDGVDGASWQALGDVWQVTFRDWDGSLLSEQPVLDGGAAEPPEPPTRENYEFLGWNPDNLDYIKGATDFIAEYGELPIYKVRINFVFADKDEQAAAQPYIAAVHRGYDFVSAAPIPEINGYVHSTQSESGFTIEGNKVKINLAAVSGDVAFTVYYKQGAIYADEIGIPLVTIGDRPVPLYGPPEHAAWALTNLILAALTLLMSVYTLLSVLFRRRKTENEDMPEFEYSTLNVKGYRKIPSSLAILTGPFAMLVFVVTENTNLFMVVVDQWTVLMATMFLAEALFLGTARRKEPAGQQTFAI